MVTSRKPNKRPSMFEVAKLAGVSHQTVSRVINDSPDVSDATRARVQAAIAELGYRPSNSARALASRRSRTIGLIAGGLTCARQPAACDCDLHPRPDDRARGDEPDFHCKQTPYGDGRHRSVGSDGQGGESAGGVRP